MQVPCLWPSTADAECSVLVTDAQSPCFQLICGCWRNAFLVWTRSRNAVNYCVRQAIHGHSTLQACSSIEECGRLHNNTVHPAMSAIASARWAKWSMTTFQKRLPAAIALTPRSRWRDLAYPKGIASSRSSQRHQLLDAVLIPNQVFSKCLRMCFCCLPFLLFYLFLWKPSGMTEEKALCWGAMSPVCPPQNWPHARHEAKIRWGCGSRW